MASGLYLQGATSTVYTKFLNQLVSAFLGQADLGGITFYAPLSAPGALTAAVASGSGNLTGAYTYTVTFVTGFVDGTGALHSSGETALGSASGVVNPSAQNVDLTSIPVGGIGVIARKVYRTKAGGTTYYFDFEISDNTTTSWTDSTTDANLGAQATDANTTGTALTIPAGISTPEIAGTPSFTQGASVPSAQTFTMNGSWAGTGAPVLATEVGAVSGVASLDATGNVPASELGNVPVASTSTDGTVELAATPASGPGQALIANATAAQTMTGPLVLTSPLQAPTNPNLVRNPTFAQRDAGWSGIGSNGFSVMWDVGGGEGPYAHNGSSNVAQQLIHGAPIPVGAGTTLTISAEVYAAGVTAGQAMFGFDFHDASGSYISNVLVAATNGQGWTRLSGTGTSPANTASIMPWFGLAANTTNTAAAWRKFKAEVGSVATAFSDDQGANPATLLGGPAVGEVVASTTRTGEVEITTASSMTTVATYTPSVSGNYMLLVYFRVAVGTTTVTVQATYADAAGAQTLSILPATSEAVGSYPALVGMVNAVAGTAIDIQVEASVANQVFASASILAV